MQYIRIFLLLKDTHNKSVYNFTVHCEVYKMEGQKDALLFPLHYNFP